MEIGLLLVRIVLAGILFMHATQKLLGWFSGPGIAKAAMIFESLGQRPGRPMALLAVASELAGAVLLLLGLATPLGAAVVAGTMLVAGAAMTMVKGTVWNAAGGGEYPLVLAGVGACLGFTGPGAWSLDGVIGFPWVASTVSSAALTGLVTVVVALVAATPPLLRTRRALSRTAQENEGAVPAT